MWSKWTTFLLVIFHLLSQGKPMIKYEQMQSLFAFLKVPNNLLKHCNDCVGWEIAKVLHRVVLIAIEKVILASSFLSISTNEMTTIDNHSWNFVHCYVVVGWNRMPTLFK
jgi:uncharacterized membrane protein